ncbi:hypothetical protein O1L55_29960 [Streptomyces albulus]|nr:hypothetical protein [Streptomyces noursei]
MADAQIILAYSRDAGIVAIASGTKYQAAQGALQGSGFHRDAAGVYRLQAEDPDASRTTVTGLVRSAKAYGVTVTTSTRRFIGDTVRDIAGLLPGNWETQVELYCHPVWQEDLVPWLWDSGELGRVVQSDRIPYAATLTESASGTTLLLVERPGHQLDYLVGVFTPEPFDEGYGEPHAPRSIVLPPFPGRAARAITDRYLPAYDRAVHARRIAAAAGALDRIRTEHDTWSAMVASNRYSDATPLDIDALGAATAQFLDGAWRDFLTVVDHAPALLDRWSPPPRRGPRTPTPSHGLPTPSVMPRRCARSWPVAPRSPAPNWARGRGRPSPPGSPTVSRSSARPGRRPAPTLRSGRRGAARILPPGLPAPRR